MITTIDRYKWLRIDGESFRVPVGDFIGMPVYVDSTLPAGVVEFRDSSGRVVGKVAGLDADASKETPA
jgi:hypothetical protein